MSDEASLQPGITATVITASVLAVLIVILRLIVRKFVVKSIGWDDWTILCAALGMPTGCALVLIELHYGFGRHKSDLSHDEYVEFTKYSYGEWIQTFFTLMFTKVSICLVLLRIVISKAFIRSLQALIVALVVSNVVLTILWILQCQPVNLAWLAPETPGSCFTELQLRQIILAQAIIAIASDFILAIYPIFILQKIHMAFRIKVGLCILMGLGIITGSLCTVRTVNNWQNVNDDPTFNSVANWYWRTWEVTIGIIAACIPALRPGYKSLRSKLSSYSRSRSSSKNTNHEKSNGTSTKASQGVHISPLPLAEVYIDGQLTVRPLGAMRPDVSEVSTTLSTAISNVDPPPHPEHSGILKTMTVDLESQRAYSDETQTGNGSTNGVLEKYDSRSALRGQTSWYEMVQD